MSFQTMSPKEHTMGALEHFQLDKGRWRDNRAGVKGLGLRILSITKNYRLEHLTFSLNQLWAQMETLWRGKIPIIELRKG